MHRAEIILKTCSRPLNSSWLVGECFPYVHFAAHVSLVVEADFREQFIKNYSTFEMASRGKPGDFEVGCARFSVIRRVNCALSLLECMTAKNQEDSRGDSRGATLLPASLVSRPEVQILYRKIISRDTVLMEILKELVSPPIVNFEDRLCVAVKKEKAVTNCLCGK